MSLIGRRLPFAVLAAVVTLGLTGGAHALRGEEATAQRPPNIVFVLADDLGRSELGVYGNRFNETPHLDQLAREGVLFSDAYAAAPVCSPYRASLMTGQHPARLGIIDYLRPDSSNAISTTVQTLPRVLAEHGYRTGMVGKWHLSGYAFHKARHEIRPTDIGFDWNIGSEVKGVGNGANFWPYVFRTQPIRWLDLQEQRMGEAEYLTDRLNLEAVDFIEQNQDRPFFLYLSHFAPHSILNGRPDLVDSFLRKHPPGPSSRTKCYLCQDEGHEGDPLHHWASQYNPHLAAMLKSIDDGVGLIDDKLKELGIAENTIVIFTSDNGGETNVTSNAPFRGGKSQLYEGGIRVPLIVRWPAQMPSGGKCSSPTSNVDFFPTLLEAAGATQSDMHHSDGVSVLAQWKEPETSAEQRDLFWHYPLDRPHFLGGVSSGAIRSGRWKLIENFDTGESELFEITNDPGEASNVAAGNPDVAQALALKLNEWRKQTGATIPSPPLLAMPGKLSFADYFTPGQISERWFFNSDWSVEDNALSRGSGGDSSTRIFLKDTKFRDAIVRFDFQFQDSHELRLVTGSNGHYNSVVHIHRDHFFVQTAMDRSVPYFSFRHGECAFDFDPDRWYSMTVEFVGDKLVAHVDSQHVAVAQHPIIDNERTYFAFQVDESAAAFDDIQIFDIAKAPEADERFAELEKLKGRFPVEKTAEEQFKILKSNTHELLYQRDAEYRALIVRLDELDAQKVELFPSAFRSSKAAKKAIQNLRKKLLEEDPKYKEMLHETHRAKRALEAYLIEQYENFEELPATQQKRQLELLRRKHSRDATFVSLESSMQRVEQQLEQAYPQLFVSDEELNAQKKKEHARLSKDPAFVRLNRERSDVYRASEDYLLEHNEELNRLSEQLKSEKKPAKKSPGKSS